jgi:medium-chain acyl-[acyl-carrier-protein] hydrolase
MNSITASKARHSRSRWFQRLSPHSAPILRVFCFPYAGGSAQIFHEWQRHLPPEIDLCLVHLPGRGNRMTEPAFTQIKPLLETLANEIRPEVNGRFAFYGHSMGALISFELTRELRRRNLALPSHLFVSGRRAPSIPDPDPITFNLPQREFMAEVQKLNGTPKEFFDHPEMRELFLPLLRADFEIVETYQYIQEMPLSCPIAVYGGTEDGHVPVETLSAWQKETTAECKVKVLPGDHFFIRSHKTEFLAALHGDLMDALRSCPEPGNS